MKDKQSMKIQDVKTTFKSWLELATLKSFVFGQSFVKQKLSDKFKFEVQLNQAKDDLAKGDFVLYPEDDNKILFCNDYSEVEEILIRDGRIPAWIDISVYKFTKDYTLFRLICAGRFTDDTKELYYYKWGTGCFGVKSPDLPFGYKEGKKFKLKKASEITSK